jgi:hypothetical protein
LRPAAIQSEGAIHITTHQRSRVVMFQLHRWLLPLDYLPENMQPFVHYRPLQIAVLKRVGRRRSDALVVIKVRATKLLEPPRELRRLVGLSQAAIAA